MELQQQGLASTEDAASSFSSTTSLRGEYSESVEERISDHIPGLGTFYLRRDKNSRKRRRDFVNLGRSQRAQIVRNAYAVVESVCDLFCPGERMDLMDAIVAIHPTYRRRYEKRVAQAAAAAAAATNGVGPRGMEMAGLMAANAQWPAFEYLRAGAAFGPVHVPMMYMDPYAAAAVGRPDMQMLSFRRQQQEALLVNGGMPTPLFTPAAPSRDSCTDAMEHLTRLAAGSLAELRSRAGSNSAGASGSQLSQLQHQHTAHRPMSQATMTPQWTGDASFSEALGALGVKSELSSAGSVSTVGSPKVMESPGVGGEGSGTHAQSAAVAPAPVIPPEALILQKLRAKVEQKERSSGNGHTGAAEAVGVKTTASVAGQPYPCGAGKVATE